MNLNKLLRDHPYAHFKNKSGFFGGWAWAENENDRSKRLLKHLRIMNRNQRRSEAARKYKTGNRGTNRVMTSGRFKHRMSNEQWAQWRNRRQQVMQFDVIKQEAH